MRDSVFERFFADSAAAGMYKNQKAKASERSENEREYPVPSYRAKVYE